MDSFHSFPLEWNFGLAKMIRSMQRTNAAPSPLIHNMAGFVQKQFIEIQVKNLYFS